MWPGGTWVGGGWSAERWGRGGVVGAHAPRPRLQLLPTTARPAPLPATHPPMPTRQTIHNRPTGLKAWEIVDVPNCCIMKSRPKMTKDRAKTKAAGGGDGIGWKVSSRPGRGRACLPP